MINVREHIGHGYISLLAYLHKIIHVPLKDEQYTLLLSLQKYISESELQTSQQQCILNIIEKEICQSCTPITPESTYWRNMYLT